MHTAAAVTVQCNHLRFSEYLVFPLCSCRRTIGDFLVASSPAQGHDSLPKSLGFSPSHQPPTEKQPRGFTTFFWPLCATMMPPQYIYKSAHFKTGEREKQKPIDIILVEGMLPESKKRIFINKSYDGQ